MKPTFTSIVLAHRWRTGLVMAALTIVLSYVSYLPIAAVSQRQRLAEQMTGGSIDKAASALRRYGCAGCHTIAGLSGADGKVGPALVDLRQRVYLAGRIRNTPEALVKWIAEPQAVSPGSAMPTTGITEAEARDVAAFLYAQ